MSTGAVVTQTSTTNSYSAAGLSYGVNYLFAVAAVNSVGTSNYATTSTPVKPYTVANAPTAVTATTTPNTNVASLSWIAPTNTFGSTITGYSVIATNTADSTTSTQTSSVNSTSFTFTGLIYGSTYTFTVAAINGAGTGSYSSSSNSLTISTTPGTPTIGTASVTADSKTATVTWTAPSNRGSIILGYYIKSSPATTTQSASSSATSMTFTGLTYDVAYTFTVAAYNVNGTGSYSSSSNSVTPYLGTPGTPTIGTASIVTGSTTATITWTAPSNGTSGLAGYRIRSTPTTSTQTAGVRATSMSFTGLSYGTSYTFTVSAVNTSGEEGSESSASNSITVLTTPNAPTIGGASIASFGQYATVSWSASTDNGGSTITGYQIASSPPTYIQTASSTDTSVSFGPLKYGTTYTFSVAAVNSAGIGTFSSASTSVTPSNIPDTPTNVAASVSSNSTSATVSWTAPSSNGSAITGYYITSTPITATQYAASSDTSMTFTGLSYGVNYTFKVAAYNALGVGSFSAFTNVVRPIRYPNAPTIGTVTNSGTSSTVTWTAPSYIGGSVITGYSVVSNPATTTQTASASATSLSFTGLVLGTSYTFSVAAVNAAGTSSYSSESESVLAREVPGIPTIGTATWSTGVAEAVITWTAPTSTGGDSISGYSVVSSPATTTQTAISSATSINFTGLTWGTTYTFAVAAINSAGTGTYSDESNSVYATYTPAAPTIGTASVVVDEESATVTWTAPSDNGGLTITEYVIVSSPATTTQTASSSATSVTFTGLTFFTNYTFQVAAVNSNGTGSYSSSSNTVTPFYYRVQATKTLTLTDLGQDVSVFLGSTSEEATTIDVTVFDDTFVTEGTSTYINDPTYSNMVLKTSFNALTSEGNKVTDFTSDPVAVEIDIPHANTSNTMRLFKLNDQGTILVPQPAGYPKKFTYNSTTGLWEGTLTAFSDYTFIDVGQGSSGSGSVGGDPHVKTVHGVYNLLPNSWKRVRMYERGDVRIVAKCQFAPEKLLRGMHIIEDDEIVSVATNYRKNWLAENLTFIYELELFKDNQLGMKIDLYTGRVMYDDGTFDINTPKRPWGLYSITGNMRYPQSDKYIAYDIMVDEEREEYISVDIDSFWDDVNNVTFHSNSKVFGDEYTGEFFEHTNKNHLK